MKSLGGEAGKRPLEGRAQPHPGIVRPGLGKQTVPRMSGQAVEHLETAVLQAELRLAMQGTALAVLRRLQGLDFVEVARIASMALRFVACDAFLSLGAGARHGLSP